MRPPCISTSRWTIARPKPLPPVSRARLVGAVESLEDMLQLIGRDAGASVGHLEDDPVLSCEL
jgi:hypothetical protein